MCIQKTSMNMIKNKYIIVGGIAAAVLIAGIWLARPASPVAERGDPGGSSPVPAGASVLAAEVSSFDFGTISMAKGTVSRTVTVKNTGAGTVTIGKMYTSCMCTTATLSLNGKRFGPYGMPGHGFVPTINEKIGAGEEATVEVVFDPAAHGPSGVGKIERSIIIENDAGEPLELGFTANVTP